MSDYEFVHVKHPSNVSALPCKMENSFIGAKIGFQISRLLYCKLRRLKVHASAITGRMLKLIIYCTGLKHAYSLYRY